MARRDDIKRRNKVRIEKLPTMQTDDGRRVKYSRDDLESSG